MSECRISWDIEHAILPIADIRSASISWTCARRRSSFRRSRAAHLSKMRILPPSEISGFLRRVATVPPCDPCSCCSWQICLEQISGGEDQSLEDVFVKIKTSL